MGGIRVGLHETGNTCSEEGLILLQLTGSKEEIGELEKQLNDMEGLGLRPLVFNLLALHSIESIISLN